MRAALGCLLLILSTLALGQVLDYRTFTDADWRYYVNTPAVWGRIDATELQARQQINAYSGGGSKYDPSLDNAPYSGVLTGAQSYIASVPSATSATSAIPSGISPTSSLRELNFRTFSAQDWRYYVNHPEVWGSIDSTELLARQMINAYSVGGSQYYPELDNLPYEGVLTGGTPSAYATPATAIKEDIPAPIPEASNDWGCQVALCMSNPAGPTAVSECEPPINRLRSHLKRGGSFPKCELM